MIFYVLTLTALSSSGAEATSFLGLGNSMDGSDDLLDPLLDGEPNPVFPYQTQDLINKPISCKLNHYYNYFLKKNHN